MLTPLPIAAAASTAVMSGKVDVPVPFVPLVVVRTPADDAPPGCLPPLALPPPFDGAPPARTVNDAPPDCISLPPLAVLPPFTPLPPSDVTRGSVLLPEEDGAPPTVLPSMSRVPPAPGTPPT